LLQPLGERVIAAAKLVFLDLVRLVEVIELVHFPPKAVLLSA